MSTEIAPLPDSHTILDMLQQFTGNQYRFLLRFLRDPDEAHNAVARAVGVSPEQAYNWRYSNPAFKLALDTIREHKQSLRSEYAKLAFEEATPRIADKMIERAEGDGKDAQRAGERILETTGVLPKPGIDQVQPNVQVNTFTYYLVQPGAEPKPFMVETTAKALPALPPGIVIDVANDAKKPSA